MEKTITFEQLNDSDFRRAEQLKTKTGATWVAFLELDGLLNISKLARRFFGKTHGWFAQKLHGNTVCNKERAFSADEYAQIARSFREIATKLNEYADAIDSSALD